jgi:hypothetical protein
MGGVLQHRVTEISACVHVPGVSIYHCHRKACCCPRYRTLHAQSQHPVRPPPCPSIRAYPRAIASCSQCHAHMHRQVTPTHLPLLRLPTKACHAPRACVWGQGQSGGNPGGYSFPKVSGCQGRPHLKTLPTHHADWTCRCTHIELALTPYPQHTSLQALP